MPGLIEKNVGFLYTQIIDYTSSKRSLPKEEASLNHINKMWLYAETSGRKQCENPFAQKSCVGFGHIGIEVSQLPSCLKWVML